MQLKNMLKTNLSLKFLSLAIGFFCWFVFSGSEYSSLILDVPVCSFSEQSTKNLVGLENVRVELRGKKSDLHALDQNAIGLHVNLDELSKGDHLLEVTNEKLLLPAPLKVVHYEPVNPVVTVVEKTFTT